MPVDTGLFYTSAWNVAPTFADGTDRIYFNEVHYLGGRYVAVGYNDATPKTPAFAYSDDGENWTIGNVDPLYMELIGGGNDLMFTDIGYNGTGYLIIGKLDGEGLAGGFYATDLTHGLYESNWVNIENFPTDANQLVYAQYPEGGENFGTWSVFSDDQKTWWATYNDDPSQPWGLVQGWDLTQILFDRTGLDNLEIAEATIGTIDAEQGRFIVWMVSTSKGQVIWWPHAPTGPFVSVPNPYTANVHSIENLNPVQVTFAGDDLPYNNERITISDAVGIVASDYFVKQLGSGVYELHSNKELDSPVDGSGWSGVYIADSATATLSRGTFIDALGYGDGKFFAGNDDEEVFICSSFGESIEYPQLNWAKVDDQNDSFVYWNDLDYGDLGSGTYTYKFSADSPETKPNYRYGGEGNLDTTVYVNDSGVRVSRQRTGYFEIVNADGGRKVVDVYDGETVDDVPEVPNIPANPTGNANVNDSGSTI